MKHLIYLKSCGIYLAFLLLSACSDFVQVDAPKNELIKGNAFSDDQSALAGISGIYSSMSNQVSSLSGSLHVVTGLYADELNFTSSEDYYNQFFAGRILAANASVQKCWTDLYQTIYFTNAFLEGLAGSEGVSETQLKQLTAEAKLIRAFCYYYLVTLWGDVPLIHTTDYQINQIFPRSDQQKVYEAITTDLIEAASGLAADYPSLERARPNKYAAMALLSRVYLQQKNWALAEAQASEILSSSLYGLSEAGKVFLKESNETIWQLKPVSANRNTQLGYLLLPGTAASLAPVFPLSASLSASFEPGDLRKSLWTASKTVSTNTYAYAAKYKIRVGDSPLNEYLIVFRLAEQILIRAEARARQGKIQLAVQDLNMIRKRAGLSALDGAQQQVVLDQLVHQRQNELFCEWGDRWFTLLRQQQTESVLGPLKAGGWKKTSDLWPLPLSEINANPKLTQNEGY